MPTEVRIVRGVTRSEPSTLWGDGFADDELTSYLAVRSWSHVSSDEYIFLFPGLLQDGVPDVVRSAIETSVAARAWRLEQADEPSHVARLRSDLPAGAGTPPRDWFGGDTVVTRLLRRLRMLRVVRGRLSAERSILTVVDRILSAIQRGETPHWSLESEALLAFGACVHPAYVWPDAALCHARGTTAGWLGFLDRGRTALMPLTVAEHLTEMSVEADHLFVELAGGPDNFERLRRLARRRRAGADLVVRPPNHSVLAGTRATSWPSPAWGVGVEA